MTSTDEKELEILESVYLSRKKARRWNAARLVGLSLGVSNSVLKRLAKRGLLKIRKINNPNIQYVVSPQGLGEIAHRSYRYLRRTINNVVCCKASIERFVYELKRQGIHDLPLVGSSALEFIAEHVSLKAGLEYRRVEPEEIEPGSHGSFLLFAESFTRSAHAEHSAHLDRTLTRPPRTDPQEAP